MGIQTDDRGDSRHYFDDSDPTRRYPGVTSIIGVLDKPFLKRWYANMAADLAIDSADYWVRMAERDPAGAKKYLAGAAWRYTRSRSDVGSKAHDLFERMIRGEHVRRVHSDVAGHKDQFAEFLDTVQPELILAEDVAWSDTHRYAGSPDAVIRIKLGEDGRPDQAGEWSTRIVDWKTGRNTYPEVALQLSAYANADKIVHPDGACTPVPSLDGGAVLHITDDQWALKPVAIGADVFGYFLHLREAFEWSAGLSRTVLGKPIAGSAAGAQTGTERRG